MTGPDPSISQNTNSINLSNLNVFVTYKDARKLADLGLCVIPIKGMDKVPAISSWKEFQKRKPSDQELHNHFDRGDKNIGIVCGKISGGTDSKGRQYTLVVTDFDDKETLEFLIEGGITKFIEKTLVAKTGKGFHVYFRVPENLSETRRFDNLKVDIKGEGGYVVAPPSIHKEGTRYQFLNDKEIEYNDKFDRFLEKLEEKDREFKYAKEVLPYWEPSKRNYLAVGLPIFLKQREKWGLDEVTDLILSINRMRPFPQDPYSDSELIAKVRNAYEKEYNYGPFLSDYIGTDELLKTLEKISPEQKGAGGKRNEWFNEEGGLQRDVVIKDVLEHFDHIISNEKTIYIWEGDHYDDQGREIISRYLQESVPEISSRVINDITEAIANITFKTREDLEQMELPLDYIPVKNGLLNWRKQILEPHNPEYFYSRRLNVNYKREAFCKGFTRYLLSRFQGNYKEMFKIIEDLALIFFRDNRYQIVSIWMGQSKDPSGLISGEEGKTLTAEVIFGVKFLGPELFSRAGLQSLKSEFEFQALKGKWLHVASLDEAGHISNYSGLIEQLRDPYIEKPVKNRPVQQRWKNTAYNILTGNKFPKATANTKAFYRSIRKIVYWRKPIGEDWRYINEINEEERSGLLNLGIFAMHMIEARGKPYGLFDLGEAISKYREISDSISMLIPQIFEKAPEERIEEGEALKHVIEEAELRDLVMENLTKTKLTALLKENFGVLVEETTVNEEKEDENKKRIKTKRHINYYKGIKIKDNKSSKQESQQTTIQNSDTFEEAVLDYVSGISEIGNIGVSEFSLPPFYMYNIILSYYSLYRPGVLNSDTPIQEFKTCLENKENSLVSCVSEFIKRIGVSGAPTQESEAGFDSNSGPQKEDGGASGQPKDPLPTQEPKPKKDDELNQKAMDFFRSLKDKFEFFKPLEEYLVTREPDNIFRHLHFVEGSSEDEAHAIISKWEELGLAQVVQNQIVLIEHAQEGEKNGNN